MSSQDESSSIESPFTGLDLTDGASLITSSAQHGRNDRYTLYQFMEEQFRKEENALRYGSDPSQKTRPEPEETSEMYVNIKTYLSQEAKSREDLNENTLKRDKTYQAIIGFIFLSPSVKWNKASAIESAKSFALSRQQYHTGKEQFAKAAMYQILLRFFESSEMVKVLTQDLLCLQDQVENHIGEHGNFETKYFNMVCNGISVEPGVVDFTLKPAQIDKFLSSARTAVLDMLKVYTERQEFITKLPQALSPEALKLNSHEAARLILWRALSKKFLEEPDFKKRQHRERFFKMCSEKHVDAVLSHFKETEKLFGNVLFELLKTKESAVLDFDAYMLDVKIAGLDEGLAGLAIRDYMNHIFLAK